MTRDEIDLFIEENYTEMTDKEIAEHCSLKEHTIRHYRNKLGLKREHKIPVERDEDIKTICWKCGHATNKYRKCSWSINYKPVVGWTATRNDKLFSGKSVESYIVHECPIFVRG